MGQVCTRFRGLHPPRGRNVRYAGQVCTRFGGLHPLRGRNRPDLGREPPSRVQTPITGALLPPRRPSQPPFQVQTPGSGAEFPYRGRPPSRAPALAGTATPSRPAGPRSAACARERRPPQLSPVAMDHDDAARSITSSGQAPSATGRRGAGLVIYGSHRVVDRAGRCRWARISSSAGQAYQRIRDPRFPGIGSSTSAFPGDGAAVRFRPAPAQARRPHGCPAVLDAGGNGRCQAQRRAWRYRVLAGTPSPSQCRDAERRRPAPAGGESRRARAARDVLVHPVPVLRRSPTDQGSLRPGPRRRGCPRLRTVFRHHPDRCPGLWRGAGPGSDRRSSDGCEIG